MQTMKGRVALVTGASRGIGEAIARRFAAEGAAVAVTARTRRDGDHTLSGSIAGTVAAIEEAGGRALAVAADLSKPEDRSRLIGEVEGELGPVDVLVNNAAVTYFEQVEAFRDERRRLMFEVQVHAPFDLVQRVVSGMRERKQGWILNISSTASVHPTGPPYEMRLAGSSVYGMCKAALERFTTGLAVEVYADRIAVNSLSPSGLVSTPGTVYHKLDQIVPKELHEPMEVMVEAAHALCTADPEKLTGRIALASPLVRELGLEPIPNR